MNVLFYQTGDFAEAYRRFEEGGPETFRDQRVSVEFVASLRRQYAVTTIAMCGREHRERLDRNLHSIGITIKSAFSRRLMVQLLDEVSPAVIVCRTPNYNVIRWAHGRRVPTLLSFADFFSNKGPKQLIRNLALRALLSGRLFPCVANRGLNSCVSISNALFYPRTRIVPWDWGRLVVNPVPKTQPRDANRLNIFFAGTLSKAKGVGDCIEAVALSRNQGRSVTVDFAGAGDVQFWRARAAELDISNAVHFLGLIPNDEVRKRMVESDVVVVPSHHDYDEGLPNTLCEALASRTPTIVSDHPAFANRLQSGENCLVFPAADPVSLADRISLLSVDSALFGHLSEQSFAALNSLYIGMNWCDLVSAFLGDLENRTGWVEANSLAKLEKGRGFQRQAPRRPRARPPDWVQIH